MADDKRIKFTEIQLLEAELFGWKMTDDIHRKYIAFKVIKSYASKNIAIPSELVPYLNEACDHFINKPGNAVSNRATDSRWAGRVLDAEVLRKCGSYTVKEACEAVVKRDGDTYGYDSLFAKRKGHPSKNNEYVDGYIEYLSDNGYTLAEIVSHILNK